MHKKKTKKNGKKSFRPEKASTTPLKKSSAAAFFLIVVVVVVARLSKTISHLSCREAALFFCVWVSRCLKTFMYLGLARLGLVWLAAFFRKTAFFRCSCGWMMRYPFGHSVSHPCGLRDGCRIALSRIGRISVVWSFSRGAVCGRTDGRTDVYCISITREE